MDIYAAAMMGVSEDVCEHLAKEVAAAGHQDRLLALAADILRRPDESIAATFWLWKAAVGGQYPEAFAGINLQSLTIRFLLAADDFAHRAADNKSLRPVVDRIPRHRRRARRGTPPGRSWRPPTIAQAKDIRAALERNACLTNQVRLRSLNMVRKTHPSHFAIKTVEAWEDKGVIYTSPASLRHQKRYRRTRHAEDARQPAGRTRRRRSTATSPRTRSSRPP